MRLLLLGSTWFLVLACLSSGCQKTPEDGVSRFEIVDNEGQAILTDKQIVGYDWATHTITLQPDAIFKVSLSRLVRGVPFSVVVDGVTCYRGAVTSEVSSYSQSCPVILQGKEKVVRIELGYPHRRDFKGDDPRGDQRVRKCLLALGKLWE